MTRKLIESTFVTLDGVIGDPQIWGPPYWDEEYAAGLVEGVDAMLLGRVTYEGFAQAWPARRRPLRRPAERHAQVRGVTHDDRHDMER